MFKVTPNPPDTDPASPNPNLQDPTDRIPSAADIRATPRKLCTMFIVNPELDLETLLAHACESLASASVMTRIWWTGRKAGTATPCWVLRKSSTWGNWQ